MIHAGATEHLIKKIRDLFLSVPPKTSTKYGLNCTWNAFRRRKNSHDNNNNKNQRTIEIIAFHRAIHKSKLTIVLSLALPVVREQQQHTNTPNKTQIYRYASNHSHHHRSPPRASSHSISIAHFRSLRSIFFLASKSLAFVLFREHLCKHRGKGLLSKILSLIPLSLSSLLCIWDESLDKYPRH
jgi:hypothetical protein